MIDLFLEKTKETALVLKINKAKACMNYCLYSRNLNNISKTLFFNDFNETA